jgi:hypothetical protein
LVLDGGGLTSSPIDGISIGHPILEEVFSGDFGGELGEVDLSEFLIGEIGEWGQSHHLFSLHCVELINLEDVGVEYVQSVLVFLRSIFLIELQLIFYNI